jgi:hypothetical protein
VRAFARAGGRGDAPPRDVRARDGMRQREAFEHWHGMRDTVTAVEHDTRGLARSVQAQHRLCRCRSGLIATPLALPFVVVYLYYPAPLRHRRCWLGNYAAHVQSDHPNNHQEATPTPAPQLALGKAAL